jgi:hypothetical protein
MQARDTSPNLYGKQCFTPASRRVVNFKKWLTSQQTIEESATQPTPAGGHSRNKVIVPNSGRPFRRKTLLVPHILLLLLALLLPLMVLMPDQSVAARVSDSTTVVSPDSVALIMHGPLDFLTTLDSSFVLHNCNTFSYDDELPEESFIANSKRTVTISKIYDLNFGGVFCGTSSGTVKVAPSGSVSYTGDVIAHNGVSGFLARQAVVQVNINNHDHLVHDDHESNDDDEYNRDEDDDNHTNDTHTSYARHGTNVTITLPSSATLTRTGGTATMTADNFTFTRTKGTFNIGATLHVGGNQVSGPYWGTFLVTVNCE